MRAIGIHWFSDGILIERTPAYLGTLVDRSGTELPEVSFDVPVDVTGTFSFRAETEMRTMTYLRADRADDMFLRTREKETVEYRLCVRSDVLPATISPEDHGLLPASLQGKYEATERTVETVTPILKDERFEIASSVDEPMAQFFDPKRTDPDADYVSVHYRSDTTRTFFVPFPLDALAQEVRAIADRRVIVRGGTVLSIDYLDTPYDGATRRVYDKFKSGRTKRTYTEVPDYEATDRLELRAWRSDQPVESATFGALSELFRRAAAMMVPDDTKDQED